MRTRFLLAISLPLLLIAFAACRRGGNEAPDSPGGSDTIPRHTVAGHTYLSTHDDETMTLIFGTDTCCTVDIVTPSMSFTVSNYTYTLVDTLITIRYDHSSRWPASRHGQIYLLCAYDPFSDLITLDTHTFSRTD